MYLSNYLRHTTSPLFPGHRVIFSTKNSALALVAEEDFLGLQDGRLIDDASTLVEQEMLVNDLELERQEVHTCLAEINRLSPVVTVAVILGMQCNFSCKYCYEGSLKGKSAISDDTMRQLVSYVADFCPPAKEKIVFDFYGGEPLLYVKQIKSLCRAMQEVTKKRQMNFECNLVSNGSLLKPELVKDLLSYGLQGVKVTIDGPPITHNHNRPYNNGNESFDRIISNLAECAGLLKIGLGGNYTRENYHSFPELLDHLQQNNLGPEALAYIKFSPVMQTTESFAPAEYNSGCQSAQEPWLAEAQIFLREAILKAGYESPNFSLSTCMVDLESAFTVHYDGSIYKCPAMIGNKKLSSGDIWSGMSDYQQQYHLNHWQKEEKCQSCTYLPLCFGGCRYMAFQRNGTMSKVDCQKDFFDATLESFIKQDVACL